MAGATTSPGGAVDALAEPARLAALRRFGLLGGQGPSFDRITSLAARCLGTPMAAVTVVEPDRIHFTSRQGPLTVDAVPTEPGLCGSAILGDDVLVVPDASANPRTESNWLVSGPAGVRFYAGAPLVTDDGARLGTLCVMDTRPRVVSDADLAVLRDLAAVVVEQLDLRAASGVPAGEDGLRRQAGELADALQASLLPPRPPALPGMELATRYQAGEGPMPVGGDFLDVFRLGTNDWGVVVGDVCGRGPRAAALAALARWAVRASSVRTFPPADVLADLNGVLLGDDAAQGDDHFCSAVLARLELDTCGAWVTLASAGHPRPVVIRRAGWIDIRGHVAPPLGLFDDAAPADDRVGLGPGDALVILTDGITEARNDTGELFGDEHLQDVLLDCSGVPAEEVADRLLASAHAFAGGELRDDVAIVVVRVPEDALTDPVGRITGATGVPADALHLPGYPLGDQQPDLWRRPPAPPREARIRLAPDPASVGVARRLLGRLLASWRLDGLAGGDIDLLTSEVATNAVLHAATELTVIVRYLGPVVRVEVGDGSTALPQAREADDDDLNGRGLLIVDNLAHDWGVLPTRQGKRVWFEVEAPS
ncbi:MAG TPA: SpoIIE family protein phosphatase [Acidimicrobiales bacterium]|nr:SpoIIE family protein phosphatase [Acidimicrobiales bacterium]